MSRHYKRHTGKNKFRKNPLTLSEYIKFLFCAIPILFLILIIAKYHIGNSLLVHYGKRTKAVVTVDISGSGRYSTACFLYNFTYNGKIYTGNSLIKCEETNKIGDSISIVYLDFWPSMNRPIYYFKQKYGISLNKTIDNDLWYQEKLNIPSLLFNSGHNAHIKTYIEFTNSHSKMKASEKKVKREAFSAKFKKE